MSVPSTPADTGVANEALPYVLHLFITGASLHSTRAIINIRNLCERYLPGRYTLEIIDVYQQKELAHAEQLIALPLLIKRLPLPERRLIGDLSDTQKVLNGLGISTRLE